MYWLFFIGCTTQESIIKATATEACQYNILDGSALDSDIDVLKTIVRPNDIAFAKDEKSKEGQSIEGALGAMMTSITSSAKAIVIARSKHTTCNVKNIKIEGEKAIVEVEQIAPKLDPEGGMAKVAALGALSTEEEKISKAEEWFKDSKNTDTTQHTLNFDHVGDVWVINFGLPEAAIAQAEANLTEQNKKIAELETNQKEISKFEVVKSKYYKIRQMFYSQPVIELTVKNGTSIAVSHAYFHGIAKSPQREVPWISEDFNYEIPGGVQPGEQVNWKLSPNMFGAWGTVNLPDDAIFTVVTVRLDGPDGKQAFSVDGMEEAKAASVKAQSDIDRIRATFLQPITPPAAK